MVDVHDRGVAMGKPGRSEGRGLCHQQGDERREQTRHEIPRLVVNRQQQLTGSGAVEGHSLPSVRLPFDLRPPMHLGYGRVLAACHQKFPSLLRRIHSFVRSARAR